MEYISTKQAAQKWGITANRISILAKEGRIPGSQRIGNCWMIPSDAPKPDDARFKDTLKKELPFRFPFYIDQPISHFNPPLSEEELQLRHVEILCVECRFEEASDVLSNLPEVADNFYVKLCAYFYKCLLCTLNINREELSISLNQYQFLMSKDFPYKKEMLFFLHSLDGSIGANKYFVNDFMIDPDYPYHPTALPYIMSLSAFSFCLKNIQNPQGADPAACELICMNLEMNNHYFCAQATHIFLSRFYSMKTDQENTIKHLRRALSLALDHKIYYYPALDYSYMGAIFDQVLEEFPLDFSKQIKALGKEYHQRYQSFMEFINTHSIYNLLPRKYFPYANFAMQGMTNKEVAAALHLSESTVSKRYSQMYDCLGISSKAELIDFFKETNSQTIFNKPHSPRK